MLEILRCKMWIILYSIISGIENKSARHLLLFATISYGNIIFKQFI